MSLYQLTDCSEILLRTKTCSSCLTYSLTFLQRKTSGGLHLSRPHTAKTISYHLHNSAPHIHLILSVKFIKQGLNLVSSDKIIHVLNWVNTKTWCLALLPWSLARVRCKTVSDGKNVNNAVRTIPVTPASCFISNALIDGIVDWYCDTADSRRLCVAGARSSNLPHILRYSQVLPPLQQQFMNCESLKLSKSTQWYCFDLMCLSKFWGIGLWYFSVY